MTLPGKRLKNARKALGYHTEAMQKNHGRQVWQPGLDGVKPGAHVNQPTIRLAAETIASSDEVTMFLLMPTP